MDISYELSPLLSSIHPFSLRHVAEGHGVFLGNDFNLFQNVFALIQAGDDCVVKSAVIQVWFLLSSQCPDSNLLILRSFMKQLCQWAPWLVWIVLTVVCSLHYEWLFAMFIEMNFPKSFLSWASWAVTNTLWKAAIALKVKRVFWHSGIQTVRKIGALWVKICLLCL